jgi:hypothetical protein
LGDIKRLAAKPAKVTAFAVDILRVLEDTKALDACLIMASLEHPKKWFSKVKTRLHVALLQVTETDLQLNEDTMPDKWKSLVLKLVPDPPPSSGDENDDGSDNDQFEESFTKTESESEARKARAAGAKLRSRRTSFEWERKGVQDYDANKMAMCGALAFQSDLVFFEVFADVVERSAPMHIKWELHKIVLER